MSSKDPKGNPLTYSYYDPLGRLEEVIQPGDIHTLYGYDAHDNLAVGHRRQRQHDHLRS